MNESIAELAQTLNPPKDNRIKVIHGELLAQKNIDAFVSFLTEDMSWGGPVNQQIMALTNHQVDEYVLEKMEKPVKGKAFSTPAFTLPANLLIFAVIEEWDDGFSGAERFLKLAIKSSLQLAEINGIRSLAIPALNSASEKFPLARGARIFANAFADSNVDAFDEVRIVCKSDDAFAEYLHRFG
jgi:O-acetyl-ADP-ribose deacetylase (regulator of RNase III)